MARVIVADHEGSELVPGRVSRAEVEAQRVLNDAHAQGLAIVERAQREANALIARARVAATEAAMEETLTVRAHAAAGRDRALAEARADVLAIGISAAEKIIGRSVESSPELMEAVVQPLLFRLRRARRMELRVHPDDARTLEPRLLALASESGAGCPIRIETDPSVTRGGCILHSDVGTLDARLETRLERVALALAPLFTGSDHDRGGPASE